MILRPGNGAPPLVAVVCSVPLLSEGIASVLENIAEVRPFPAGGGDTAGLLRSLRPDGVVVDSYAEAEAAEEFARETHVPLVHVLLREGALRVLADDVWDERDGDAGATPEEIRNILVAGMYRRESVA